MIEIICGVYGGENGLKRPGDKPFSLSPAEEARLVSRKVARYVEQPKLPTIEDEPDEDESDFDEDADTPIGFGEIPPDDFGEIPELPDGVTAIPEYSVDMKPAELREIGKLCGLTFKVGMSKQEMVDALDKFFEENLVDDADTIDPEDAPTFDAAEAVEE